MNINIQTVHFDADEKLLDFVEKKVQKLLILLGMEHAQLKIEIGILEQLSSTGLDDVNYLFAPNKGSQFNLLKKTASGGELSRIMLGVKFILSRYKKLPTLIFDEIDTGVSGEIAIKMGEIMKEMSAIVTLTMLIEKYSGITCVHNTNFTYFMI